MLNNRKFPINIKFIMVMKITHFQIKDIIESILRHSYNLENELVLLLVKFTLVLK